MSADDDDPRHLIACRTCLADAERMLLVNRHRNERLSADNDALRTRIARAVEELERMPMSTPEFAMRVVRLALGALR